MGIQVEPKWKEIILREKEKAAGTGGRIRKNGIYAVEQRRQALTRKSVEIGMLIPLGITAMLAAPHMSDAPIQAAAPVAQETAAPSEASAVPSAAPAPAVIDENYVQLEDWALVLVNDTVALPADFEVAPTLYGSEQVNSKIYSALSDMLAAAAADGIQDIWVASAYRSVEDQESILESAIQNRMRDYGMTREEAEQNALLTIQEPGHSEHHTGLAVDFNNVASDFEETDAYAWLMENAENYGFVKRYPADKEDITGIDYECWHFRYVGRDNAIAMNDLNMCLEEYVLYLKNQA